MSLEIESHIHSVQIMIERIIQKLRYRAQYHDATKLSSPEYEIFKKYSQKLQDAKFGTEKYFAILNETEFQECLKHHYSKNDHHPQFNQNGIDGMSLLSLIEMLADWKSASNAQGNSMLQSLKIQKERFQISDQLYHILENTIKEMEWQL